jgi:hypothetical protein
MVFGAAVVTMRAVLLLWIASVLDAHSIMVFEPPGPQTRLEAIGATDSPPAALQRALRPA